MPSVCDVVTWGECRLFLVVLVARVDVEQLVSLVFEEADDAVSVLHQGLGFKGGLQTEGVTFVQLMNSLS